MGRAPQARFCSVRCRSVSGYKRTGRNWQKNNPVKVAAKSRKWRGKHPEKAAANSALHAKRHPQENRRKVKEWAVRNLDKVRAARRRYEMSKIRAMPKWLNDEQKFGIDQIYEIAQKLTEATGIPHQVDHIIPLRGQNVCGLHVPWNLRPIEASYNHIKGNRIADETGYPIIDFS